MRSYIFKFAQQGVWASLSGGWYFDPNHSTFTNIFHLYAWLFLLCFPYILYLVTSLTWTVCISYTTIIAIFFITLKCVNLHLHKVFDTGKQLEKKAESIEIKTPAETELLKQDKSHDDSKANESSANRVHFESGENDESPANAESNRNTVSTGQYTVSVPEEVPVLPIVTKTQLWNEISQLDVKGDNLQLNSVKKIQQCDPNEDQSKNKAVADVHPAKKKVRCNRRLHAAGSLDEQRVRKQRRRKNKQRGKQPRRRVAIDRCISIPDRSSDEDGIEKSKGHGNDTLLPREQGRSSVVADVDMLDGCRRTGRKSTTKAQVQNHTVRCRTQSQQNWPRRSKVMEGRKLTRSLSQTSPTTGMKDTAFQDRKEEPSNCSGRSRVCTHQRSQSSTVVEIRKMSQLPAEGQKPTFVATCNKPTGQLLAKNTCQDQIREEEGAGDDRRTSRPKEVGGRNVRRAARRKGSTSSLTSLSPTTTSSRSSTAPSQLSFDPTTSSLSSLPPCGDRRDAPLSSSFSDEGDVQKSQLAGHNQADRTNDKHGNIKPKEKLRKVDLTDVTRTRTADKPWLPALRQSDDDVSSTSSDDERHELRKFLKSLQRRTGATTDAAGPSSRQRHGSSSSRRAANARLMEAKVQAMYEKYLQHSSAGDTDADADDDGAGAVNDDDNVEVNFRECLQNFQQIPKHVHKERDPLRRSQTTSRPRSYHHHTYTTRGRLRRTASTARHRSSAPTPSSAACRLPSAAASRQRHPAGDDATTATTSRKDSSSKDFELVAGGRRSMLSLPPAPAPRFSTGSGPGPSVADVTSDLLDVCKTDIHLARNHADTSEGAVHSFQDEFGRWMTYTFSSEGVGVATELDPTREVFSQLTSHQRSGSGRLKRIRGDSASTTTSQRHPVPGGASEDDDASRFNFGSEAGAGGMDQLGGSRHGRLRLPEHQQFLDAIRRSLDTGQRMPYYRADTSPSSIMSQLDVTRRAPSPKAKVLYKVKIAPWKSITLQYDRLALLDLLDRNTHFVETLLAVMLSVAAGLVGLLVLKQELLHDLTAFWFCVIIATSQFSLIRSVQPDSASPTHGHNRIVAYSRPVYFVLCSLLLLLFNYLAAVDNVTLPGVPLYGAVLFDNAGCAVARDFLYVFTLTLPGIFLFGLLPQVNTFVMLLFEQIDIHLFGGSASTSLLVSVFTFVRNCVVVLLLYGFCYGAMQLEESSQHILFSAFCGPLVSISYHLSRLPASPWWLWLLLKSRVIITDTSRARDAEKSGSERAGDDDPVKVADDVGSKYIDAALSDRLQSDVVLCPIITVFAFAIHCSSVFTALQPTLTHVLYVLVLAVGVSAHYLLPQLRNNYPWLLFCRPILKSHEFGMFEVKESARIMWYERTLLVVTSFERNVLYPLLVMNELTRDAPAVIDIYGSVLGSAMVVVIGMKLMRSCYNRAPVQYLVFAAAFLFTHYDGKHVAGPPIISYFLFGILFAKIQDLMLKLHFWLVYIAPWQITWGSAFHAFAQPFIVPHSAFLAANSLLATLIHAPFTPFLGSAIFLSSYARPLKFWERDYNTKRSDHSNTRLSSQLERGTHCDDNNLNSIFYEHLTNSLQRSLAGDLAMGRWGTVHDGDCFILASDHLNAMVHVVETGNGLVTFQLRGLEFTGTYCQQREVEAINEGVDTNESCLCFKSGRPSCMLSFNSAFNQRWLAWQVVVRNYVLDGYSISDNNAATMLGVFDLRKILIGYIVKSLIYFAIAHDSLVAWLDDVAVREQIAPCERQDYADVDSSFAVAVDDDYDVWSFGVSLVKFRHVYGDWVAYCCSQRKQCGTVDSSIESKLMTFCFAISVLGRRALSTASHNLSPNLDSFLYGLHALFKGDFRITSPKDEWVFRDMNILREVVAPGVRTALKLHQDHFAFPDEFERNDALFKAIDGYTKTMVITHEGDPVWRTAVLSNTPSLLALRRVVSETFVDQYSVVTLNHRALGFTVVKVNRECVRGLWAGQQSELVFLRNRNPERGSIQNAKQVLRNMINSSCDQPIGYPIYVSPLTTSFASTNKQLLEVLGRVITFATVRKFVTRVLTCLRQSCSGSCNSGGSGPYPPPIQPIPLATLAVSAGARAASQQQPGATGARIRHPMRNVSASSTTAGNPQLHNRKPSAASRSEFVTTRLGSFRSRRSEGSLASSSRHASGSPAGSRVMRSSGGGRESSLDFPDHLRM